MGRRKYPDGGAKVIDLTADDTAAEHDEEAEEEAEEEILSIVDGIRITHRHETILKDPHAWLNDEIISAFCARLASLDHTQHYCSTFFYTKLSDMSTTMDREWLRRWHRTVGNDVNRIFVPVNWGNSHWALVVFDVGERILRYYDSMMSGARGREALTRVKRALDELEIATKTVEPERPRKKEEPVGVLAFLMSRMSLGPPLVKTAQREIKMEMPSGQPRQTDGSSCGVFVCWWIGKVSGHLPTGYERPDPLRFRKAILATLLSPL